MRHAQLRTTHARMRKLVVLERLSGRYPLQGSAHIAHGAALLAAPRWPSRRLVSGSSTLGRFGSTLGRLERGRLGACEQVSSSQPQA